MARRPDLRSGPARLVALAKTTIPPMHPAGLPFVGASLAVAAAGRRNRWLRRAGLLAAGANAAFFRHPPRVPPTRPGVVVAPADGLICLVEEAVPPAELNLPDRPLPRISIFLSIFDAHVQRIPISGEVVAVVHRPGLYKSAELAAASQDNERNSVLIRTPEGHEVVAVQIAGLIARRIVCDIAAGRQGDDRRHLRPDPVRVAAGHLPAGGIRAARAARPAGGRRRDDPCGAAAMKPRVKRPVVSLRMLPSAMTVAAICLGLSAVKFALDDRPTEAMAFLAVAAILDALDGRIARLLKATSKMGEEIDSLADAVNFGVAPAFIVYGTLLSHSRIGWIVVLLYAVCIVLRLARYNTMLAEDQPAYTNQFFVGMPAPAGAIGAIGPLAAKMQFGDGWWTSEPAVVIWMIGVSLLAVSTIPMRKIHTFAISQNMVVPLLALLADRRRRVDPVRLRRDPVDHPGLRDPHPVRGADDEAWLSKHPEVWDDKPKAQRQARRAIRRAQPHRTRSMARLGLRRPPGP